MKLSFFVLFFFIKMPPSIIDENINVEIKVLPKKGRANVKHTINPSEVYPYEPRDQTPKFVIKKNKLAPIKAPDILLVMLKIKNLDNKPIKITLPQVNNVTPWKPIIKSVIAKQKIKAGINLTPKIAGM